MLRFLTLWPVLVTVRMEEPLCCMQFMGTTCAVWKYSWVSTSVIHGHKIFISQHICTRTQLQFLGNVSCVLSFNMFASFPESGADPTIESDSGFNAMDMAVAMGHRNGTFTGIVYML